MPSGHAQQSRASPHASLGHAAHCSIPNLIGRINTVGTVKSGPPMADLSSGRSHALEGMQRKVSSSKNLALRARWRTHRLRSFL
eukprot:2086733-Amphidinium_carterae.1